MNAAWHDVVGRAGALQTELDEMGVGRPKARRGTSNGNANGNSKDRRRRKEWLVKTYRANEDAAVAGEGPNAVVVGVPLGQGEPACRCYRCGKLLTFDTVTVDRIVPGCVKTKRFPNGGTYVRENIRPACGDCNSETGGRTRRQSKHACPDCRREDPNDTRRPRKLVEWSGVSKCATHTRRPFKWAPGV